MKKKWIVTALAACAIALAGCKIVSEPEPIAVQSVILSETTLTLEYAETRILTATVYPYNADDKTVTWSSSNTDAVGVNCFNGTITANNVGTSIITARAGGCMATCEVTVKPQVVGVNYVTLNETTITLEPNARHILTATAHPDNADDKSVTWSSSNPDVARVYSDGVSDGMVVAISTGSATITAHVGECTASCAVYVNDTAVEQPGFPVPVEVESITLNTSTLMLEPNTTSSLTATVTPSNADDKTVIWRTSDYWVATVDYYDGTVTAHNEGTATITAQAGGKTAECVVTVRHIANPVTGVTLDKTELTLTRGDECTLTATVTPSNADYKSVTWTCDSYPDWGVLDFSKWDNTCTVTALEMCTATITATTVEGGFTATCEVTVLPISIDSITFLGTTLSVACDETGSLGYKITPDEPDDRTLIWSSSDEAIATVDKWGEVTGHKVGTATITATAKVGGKTATYEVKVHKHSYRDGKCTECGANPTMKNGTIDENGVLTKYYAVNTEPVVIPEGVTAIGDSAFYPSDSNYWNLTSVTIPDSVKSIGNYAFRNCPKLKNVTMGNGVTSIGNNAFDNCPSLTNVTIGDNVKSIGDKAFYNCTFLSRVTIPASVTSIGKNAFENCSKTMMKIEFKGTLAQWKAIKGSGDIDSDIAITCIICSDGHIGVRDVPIYLKMSGRTVTGVNGEIPADLVIPDGVTSIGNSAFSGYRNTLKKVTIPDSVTSIGENAFQSCSSLESVTIGNSVTSIGNSAFAYCTSLTSITIPASVTSIGGGAFTSCTSLTSITIPNGVTSIRGSVFYRCTNLRDVTIPSSVTSIESSTFSGCTSLASVKIPASVTSIEGYAFEKCTSLTSVYYSGTKDQWNAITKSTTWNTNTGSYTITCTNGSLSKE